VGDENAYLIPEFDDEMEAERIFIRVYEEVFRKEAFLLRYCRFLLAEALYPYSVP